MEHSGTVQGAASVDISNWVVDHDVTSLTPCAFFPNIKHLYCSIANLLVVMKLKLKIFTVAFFWIPHGYFLRACFRCDNILWCRPLTLLFFLSQFGEEEVSSGRLDADFPDFDLSQLDASDFDSVNCLGELPWCNEQSDQSPASIQYSAGDPELFEVGTII